MLLVDVVSEVCELLEAMGTSVFLLLLHIPEKISCLRKTTSAKIIQGVPSLRMIWKSLYYSTMNTAYFCNFSASLCKVLNYNCQG